MNILAKPTAEKYYSIILLFLAAWKICHHPSSSPREEESKNIFRKIELVKNAEMHFIVGIYLFWNMRISLERNE